MLQKWHDSDPMTFGIIFIFLYGALDIIDSRWFIPRMRPVCNGEITDQQARACSGWIRKINNKEQTDVRITERRSRPSSRYTSPDIHLREQERAINDFGGRENR